jgi:hypothetical protein
MEFEQIRLAAVAHLGNSRYQAVLDEFEKAYHAVENIPPDSKQAVRAMFEAIETLFRLTVGPKAKRLGSSEIKSYLLPMIQSLYDDPLARNMTTSLVNGLAEWANGLQAYRHGQPVEEPSPPPFEAAVAALQTGSAYIRLLIELDQRS